VTAREDVLRRIRTALGTTGLGTGPTTPRPPDPPAGYRTRSDLGTAALLDLLAERLSDYQAVVRRASAATLAGEVSAALTRRDARRIVVPPGLRAPLPDFTEVTVDDGLSAAELDQFDGVVTGAAVAIAETGTIVLAGGPDQGRRAISLVPDYHLCIVTAGHVVHLVPEAVARLAGTAGRPLTWISGPSATSDIELERVEGVHGPRTLEVILVTEWDEDGAREW
jgi:L-lactate dehydrogenase complex protein LldG